MPHIKYFRTHDFVNPELNKVLLLTSKDNLFICETVFCPDEEVEHAFLHKPLLFIEQCSALFDLKKWYFIVYFVWKVFSLIKALKYSLNWVKVNVSVVMIHPSLMHLLNCSFNTHQWIEAWVRQSILQVVEKIIKDTIDLILIENIKAHKFW